MSIRDCFNKAAESYDSNCQIQLYSGLKLLNLINKPEAVAIDLGCGTGIITQYIKCRKLYALDIADKLLAKARQRLNGKEVIFLEDSFDAFNGLELDLAFANMSLQWSDDLSRTLANISANLKYNGSLLFSLPLKGGCEEIYAKFSMEEVKKLLEDWRFVHISQEKVIYHFSSLIDSLKSMKAVGANHYKGRRYRLISRNKRPHQLVYNIGYFLVEKR
jgi:malonyl-CoA O-methyltransferase